MKPNRRKHFSQRCLLVFAHSWTDLEAPAGVHSIPFCVAHIERIANGCQTTWCADILISCSFSLGVGRVSVSMDKLVELSPKPARQTKREKSTKRLSGAPCKSVHFQFLLTVI